MGSEILRRLRDEALMLPEDERAELARDLVKSLDTPADEDVARDWDAELQSRLAEIDAGMARLVNSDEFRRRMQARLDSR